MSISRVRFIGETAFEDCCEPVISRNEFGIDVLTRKMKGAVTRLHQFLNSLRRGAVIPAFPGFYLQYWSANEDPVYPEVMLTYKGKIGGDMEDATASDDITLQNCVITTTDPQEASREILYEALTTTWRYTANKRPVNALKGFPSWNRDPVIRSNVIKVNTGGQMQVYFGLAPAPLVTALTPTIENRMIGLRSSEVFGTPFFEVEETICRMYEEQNGS